MLHSGHVAFFDEAAKHGDLYVGIGSDKTIYDLKGRKTINTEQERLYMVKALRSVTDAWINQGSGVIDFMDEIKALQPDILFVNTDGHTALKENLCKELGIQYVVSQRNPHEGLPVRSTTSLRQECLIPYRVELAGGWLDQSHISSLYPGHVITICIEPDYEFNDRSGMSTSSRKKAIELWQTNIPAGNKELLAKTLFCFENPPGTKYISGSQDALGITMPGLNRYYYDGDFWPSKIDSCLDNDILDWLEKVIWLIPLYPRNQEYDVLANTCFDEAKAKELSIAADESWDAMLAMNVDKLGKATTRNLEAQLAMYPNMVSPDIMEIIDKYKPHINGIKLTGAGGGGYLVVINETPIENAIKIRIRRDDYSS